MPVAEDVVGVCDQAHLLRPSDRLPWSDPTIARLVSNLQDEVRGERRKAKLEIRTSHVTVADLDPPSSQWGHGLDWRNQPRWS
jgi:hypothetical protein